MVLQIGIYTIPTAADDLTTFFMGPDMVFECSSQHKTSNTTTFISINVGTAPTELNLFTKEIFLKAGMFHPFKLVYINFTQRVFLGIGFNKPNGTLDHAIGQNSYSFSEEVENSTDCIPIEVPDTFTTELSTEYKFQRTFW